MWREHYGIKLRHQFVAFHDGKAENDVGRRTDPFVCNQPDFIETTRVYGAKMFVLASRNFYCANWCAKCENVFDFMYGKWDGSFWISCHGIPPIWLVA